MSRNLKHSLLAVSLIAVAVVMWARVLASSKEPTLETELRSLTQPSPLVAHLVARVEEPTDIQFVPGQEGLAVVLEKGGRALVLDVATAATVELFKSTVRTSSELGLLGLAFHPRFAENGLFYVNSNPSDGKMRTEISEWNVEPGRLRKSRATKRRVLLEVDQPYANHDAGQLLFGPDGMLFIGLGDGGSAGDPEGHGQNPDFLGSMLRIDVDGAHQLPAEGPGFRRGRYGIPVDNPKVQGWPPETFAVGLRNPWRATFDLGGRLIVADVGQGAYEEIDVVRPGANFGWNVREGRHCYAPPKDCPTSGLVDPIYEYGRDLGGSVTGGYVLASRTSSVGEYVFADFLSGHFFMLDLASRAGRVIGRLPMAPSTFGMDRSSQTLYVADYRRGGIYRLELTGAGR